jgi:hypothetical protein
MIVFIEVADMYKEMFVKMFGLAAIAARLTCT